MKKVMSVAVAVALTMSASAISFADSINQTPKDIVQKYYKSIENQNVDSYLKTILTPEMENKITEEVEKDEKAMEEIKYFVKDDLKNLKAKLEEEKIDFSKIEMMQPDQWGANSEAEVYVTYGEENKTVDLSGFGVKWCVNSDLIEDIIYARNINKTPEDVVKGYLKAIENKNQDMLLRSIEGEDIVNDEVRAKAKEYVNKLNEDMLKLEPRVYFAKVEIEVPEKWEEKEEVEVTVKLGPKDEKLTVVKAGEQWVLKLEEAKAAYAVEKKETEEVKQENQEEKKDEEKVEVKIEEEKTEEKQDEVKIEEIKEEA